MRVLRALVQHAGDVLVVALAVATQLEFWLGSVPDTRWAAVFGLLGTLPLLARRRYPFAAPVFLGGAAVAAVLVDQAALSESIAWVVAMIVAMWSLGLGNDLRRALLGGAIAFGCTQVLNRTFEDSGGAGDVLFTALVIWGPLLTGRLLRLRSQRARSLADHAAAIEREREERVRAAAVAERVRIARELHDVVAHSLGVMTVQAGAARLVLDADPDRAEESLLSVEETGRDALAEMRRLLGVLDFEGSGSELVPQPSLLQVGVLAEQLHDAGLAVDLTVEGAARALSPGVDLAAYRIVQESLTNVLKHAGTTRARVTVAYHSDAIELQVEDDGQGRPQPSAAGGHGLVGMRERAAMYGGTLVAGPREPAGYGVRAIIPLAEDGR